MWADELDIADKRYATPGNGCGPESGDIGEPSADCGEMRVRGGKQVETDARTENLLRKWCL